MPPKDKKTQMTIYYTDGTDKWSEIKDITQAELQEAMSYLEESVEFERVRYGEWIDLQPNLPDSSYMKDGMARFCSVCGHRAGKYKYRTYKYCPWCGAKMRKEE